MYFKLIARVLFFFILTAGAAQTAEHTNSPTTLTLLYSGSVAGETEPCG